MTTRYVIQWDNDWIIEHSRGYKNWGKLCAEYNSAHNTDIKPNTFKSHCNREMGLNNHYTKEQDEWLKENYPKLGRVKCTEQFNKVFSDSEKSMSAICVHCKRIGLHVTEERKKMKAIENTGRFHEIGTIRKFQNNESYIKTQEGWKKIKELVWGEEIPKGCHLIHLDGDTDNNNRNNLYLISKSVSALMMINDFWSENPEITKTGIICCDLQNNLKAN